MSDQIYRCQIPECGMMFSLNQTDKIIDHIYGHSPLSDFRLSKERAAALHKFLYDNGYISYELHPIVIDIVKDLDTYLKGEDNANSTKQ